VSSRWLPVAERLGRWDTKVKTLLALWLPFGLCPTRFKRSLRLRAAAEAGADELDLVPDCRVCPCRWKWAGAVYDEDLLRLSSLGLAGEGDPRKQVDCGARSPAIARWRPRIDAGAAFLQDRQWGSGPGRPPAEGRSVKLAELARGRAASSRPRGEFTTLEQPLPCVEAGATRAGHQREGGPDGAPCGPSTLHWLPSVQAFIDRAPERDGPALSRTGRLEAMCLKSGPLARERSAYSPLLSDGEGA